GKTSGKAAHYPRDLYDYSPVGDVVGLSGPIDGERCHACAVAVAAADLLLGGNKRDASAAVETYANYCVMIQAPQRSFLPQVSITSGKAQGYHAPSRSGWSHAVRRRCTGAIEFPHFRVREMLLPATGR